MSSAALLLITATGAAALEHPLPVSAEPVPPAGLQLPATRVPGPGQQITAVQLIFQGNYPLLAVSFREGAASGIELGLHGLFHHQRVDGFGRTWKYDYDGMSGTLRWTALRALPGAGAGTVGGGFDRMYTRQTLSDGGYSFFKRRYWWVEALADAGVAAGARVTTAVRRVWEVETAERIDTVAASAELPPVAGLAILGETVQFVRNPFGWRRPWAAGVRLPAGRHRLHAYLSNTWGPTIPDALYGTGFLFYNVRVTFSL